jgi:predicted glycosyltransferase
MNPKITKLQAERGKNVEKITTLQTRNREIDGQITELENLDIVGIVRDNGITPEMLAEIIKAMKEKPLPAANVYHKETEEITDET